MITRKEKQFLAVTFPFFFILGPFQTLVLLSTGWTISPQWDYLNLGNRHHVLPQAQILDNFAGLPAIWFMTWVIYVAYTRGHFDVAIIDLLESLHGINRPKRGNNHQA